MKVIFITLLAVLALVLVISGAELYLRHVTPNFHIEDEASDKIASQLLTAPVTIVLLGGGTKTDQPVLADRLFCAEEAFRKWPAANVFVSGNNVSSSEVSAMKSALLRHQVIPESAMVLDGDATNTRLSFEKLRELLSQDHILLICTNEFHQRRSVALARGYGFQAWAFGHDRSRYQSALLLFLRERLSRVKWMIESTFKN